MFQLIFIFSDLILDKANHSFLHPFHLGETDFQKILPGVLSRGLGHE